MEACLWSTGILPSPGMKSRGKSACSSYQHEGDSPIDYVLEVGEQKHRAWRNALQHRDVQDPEPIDPYRMLGDGLQSPQEAEGDRGVPREAQRGPPDEVREKRIQDRGTQGCRIAIPSRHEVDVVEGPRIGIIRAAKTPQNSAEPMVKDAAGRARKTCGPGHHAVMPMTTTARPKAMMMAWTMSISFRLAQS